MLIIHFWETVLLWVWLIIFVTPADPPRLCTRYNESIVCVSRRVSACRRLLRRQEKVVLQVTVPGGVSHPTSTRYIVPALITL